MHSNSHKIIIGSPTSPTYVQNAPQTFQSPKNVPYPPSAGPRTVISTRNNVFAEKPNIVSSNFQPQSPQSHPTFQQQEKLYYRPVSPIQTRALSKSALSSPPPPGNNQLVQRRQTQIQTQVVVRPVTPNNKKDTSPDSRHKSPSASKPSRPKVLDKNKKDPISVNPNFQTKQRAKPVTPILNSTYDTSFTAPSGDNSVSHNQINSASRISHLRQASSVSQNEQEHNTHNNHNDNNNVTQNGNQNGTLPQSNPPTLKFISEPNNPSNFDKTIHHSSKPSLNNQHNNNNINQQANSKEKHQLPKAVQQPHINAINTYVVDPAVPKQSQQPIKKNAQPEDPRAHNHNESTQQQKKRHNKNQELKQQQQQQGVPHPINNKTPQQQQQQQQHILYPPSHPNSQAQPQDNFEKLTCDLLETTFRIHNNLEKMPDETKTIRVVCQHLKQAIKDHYSAIHAQLVKLEHADFQKITHFENHMESLRVHYSKELNEHQARIKQMRDDANKMISNHHSQASNLEILKVERKKLNEINLKVNKWEQEKTQYPEVRRKEYIKNLAKEGIDLIEYPPKAQKTHVKFGLEQNILQPQRPMNQPTQQTGKERVAAPLVDVQEYSASLENSPGLIQTFSIGSNKSDMEYSQKSENLNTPFLRQGIERIESQTIIIEPINILLSPNSSVN